MPRFDDLAADQKAVLQLLLKQGKSYDDIARLLRMNRSSVRERALDALDALGADAPAAGRLDATQQDQLADHLLHQQDDSERRATRELLRDSAAGRSWARTVATELGPLGGAALSDVPDEPTGDSAAAATRDDRPVEPADAPEARGPSPAAARQRPDSSKLGGILILVAVGAVIGLGLILLLRKDDPRQAAASSDSAVVATAAAGATGTVATPPDQQINLAPPKGADAKALGFALVQQNSLAFQAQGLPRSDTYVIWLWNSAADALPLGIAKYLPKTKRVGGSLAALPEESVKYASIVITRQKTSETATPGPVVLSGPLKRS